MNYECGERDPPCQDAHFNLFQFPLRKLFYIDSGQQSMGGGGNLLN